jgi:hypothetical protein
MRVGTPGRGGAPQLHRARGPAEGVRLLFAAAGARARITDDGGRKTENGGRRGGRGPAASGNASAGEGSGSRTGSGRCTLRRGALGWTVVGGRWSVVGGRLPMDFGLGYRSPSTHYPLLATRYRERGGLGLLDPRLGRGASSTAWSACARSSGDTQRPWSCMRVRAVSRLGMTPIRRARIRMPKEPVTCSP